MAESHRARAAAGHAEAQYQLGLCYVKGRGVARDLREATRLFLDAMLLGHAKAEEQLYYVPVLDVIAFVEAERVKAEGGDLDAIARVGAVLSVFGAIGAITQGRDEASMYLHRAATAGHGGAALTLGRTQMRLKDVEGAIAWFRKGADKGDPACLHELGICMQAGIGVPRDRRAAIATLTRAAAKGNAESMHLLALSIADGLGVRQDETAGLKWLVKAADHGHPAAQRERAILLETALGKDLPPEARAHAEAQAVHWYGKAAEGGDTVALRVYGTCLLEGLLVPRDEARGIECLAEASDAGDVEARFRLAAAMLEGRGTERDDERALELLEEAAEHGHADAQYLAGVCLELGKGHLPDDEAALDAFVKAAKRGHAGAACAVGHMVEVGRGEEQSEGKARAMYAQAAKMGHPTGQYHLGRFLEYGIEGPRDLGAAIESYAKAAWGGRVAGAIVLGGHAAMGQAPAVAAALLQGVPETRAGEDSEAEGLLRDLAGDKALVAAMCFGCGGREPSRLCVRCGVARHCSPRCAARAARFHDDHCEAWTEESDAISPAPTDAAASPREAPTDAAKPPTSQRSQGRFLGAAIARDGPELDAPPSHVSAAGES